MTQVWPDLKDKVAIITGGAGTLGSAMADGLAQAGVRIGILSRTPAKVQAKVDQIMASGGQALALPADVLDRQQLETARTKLLDEWGRLDILINCAGGNMRGATITPEQNFFDLSPEDLDRVTALNLKGTVLPTLVFAQSMATQKAGSIINISSMAAQRPLTRIMGYAASKAAIDNFTRWLAVEMAQKFGPGLRVNAVAPGFFIGAQNRSLLLNEDESLTSRGQTIIDHTPMRRFGKPTDLCGVINWLCSDAAAFVTGAVIPIDGGFSAFSGV